MPQSQMCNDLIGIRDNHGCRSYHTSASGKGCQYQFVHAIVLNTLRTGVTYIRTWISAQTTAVFGCLTNALARPPIALESCSVAQTDQQV